MFIELALGRYLTYKTTLSSMREDFFLVPPNMWTIFSVGMTNNLGSEKYILNKKIEHLSKSRAIINLVYSINSSIF